ncbi:MAG: LamG domain-containing protein [Candidatus Odinarchaeia archaeon]
MINKKQTIALTFTFMFVMGMFVGLVHFTEAQTAYPTDGNNGNTITPVLDPFSDYDFNETHPLADELGRLYCYYTTATLSSGSLTDTYVSDDVRIEFSPASYEEFHFSGVIPSGSVFRVVLEGYCTDTPLVDIYDYSSGSWVNLGAMTESETTQIFTLTNTNGKYSSASNPTVKIRIGVGLTDAYIDFFVVEIQDENGNYMTVWAEDFSDVGEWSVRSPSTGTTTYSTDGDIVSINFTLDSDYLNGIYTEVSIDTNDYPFVEVYVSDFQIGGGATNNTTWRLRFYDGSVVYNCPDENTTGLFRYNIKQITHGAMIEHIYIVIKLRTNGEGWASVKVDWLRIYSLEDYSYGDVLKTPRIMFNLDDRRVIYNPYNGSITGTFNSKHDGTIYGSPTWVSGYDGTALHFDGVDDYVSIPDHSDFDGGSSITLTVAVWFKLPAGETKAPLVGKCLDSTYKDWLLRVYDNQIRFDAEASGENYQHAAGTVPNEVWNFGAFVVDGGTNLYLYINDTQVGSYDDLSGHSASTSANVEIAAITYVPDYSNVIIDKVYIYKRALSSSEIQSLYQGNMIYDDLVAYYDFDENGGNILHDKHYIADGVFGNAYRFTGRHYITYTGLEDFGTTTTKTIVCLFKLDEDGYDSYLSQPLVSVPWFRLDVRKTTNELRARFDTSSGAKVARYELGTGNRDWHFAVAIVFLLLMLQTKSMIIG